LPLTIVADDNDLGVFDAVSWPANNCPFILNGEPLQMTDLTIAVRRKTAER